MQQSLLKRRQLIFDSVLAAFPRPHSSSARLKTLLLVTMTMDDSSWPGLADGDAVNLSAMNTLSTTLSCLGMRW